MKKKEFRVKVTKAENDAMVQFSEQRLALRIEMGLVQKGMQKLWKDVAVKYEFDDASENHNWNPKTKTIYRLGLSLD